MDEELNRQIRRWHSSEETGRDDDADAAFAGVIRGAIRREPVSAQFTARTMAAVLAAAERDAHRAQQTRRVLLPAAALSAVGVVYSTAGLMVTAVSTSFVWLLDMLVAAVVAAATTLPAGGDMWSVLSGIGHATAALLANPTVTITVIAIQGIALAALAALQRLLRSDEESLR